MPNTVAPYEADSVSFDLHRDRESLAGVIADARIAELDDVPLADEEHPSTRRARNASRGPARARRRKYRATARKRIAIGPRAGPFLPLMRCGPSRPGRPVQ